MTRCPACGADAPLSLQYSTVFLFERDDMAIRGKCEACPFVAFWSVPKDAMLSEAFDLRAYLDTATYTTLTRSEAQPSTPDS